MEIPLKIPGKKKPDILYHYCPTEAFYGIISTQKLWLSSSIYSHDPHENKIVKRILVSRMETEKGDFKNFLQEIINHYEWHEDVLTPFIACFSEEPDDLSQWRFYANDGKGFSIGLQTRYLPRRFIWDYIFSMPGEDIPKLDDFFIGEVIYEKSEQDNFVNRLIDMMRLSFKIMEEGQVAMFARKLYMISSMFKDNTYKSEKEWQLIQYPVFHPKSKLDKHFSFRPTQNAIIPYTQYSLEQDEENKDVPIKSVLIGPCNKSSKKEIDNFGYFNYYRWWFNSTQHSKVEYLGK